MTGTTPRYGFPYPEDDTPVMDSAPIVKELAEKIEARIGADLDPYLPPIGSVIPYFGAAAPAGGSWLVCDGSAIPAGTQYDALRALVGANVPNLRGRFVVGVDPATAAYDAVGKTGGAAQVGLTVSNMPAHGHTGSVSGLSFSGSASSGGDHTHSISGSTAKDGNHRHLYYETTGVSNTNTSGGGALTRVSSLDAKWSNTFGTIPDEVTHTHSFSASASGGGHTHPVSGSITGGTVTVGNNGSGQAFSTVPPYVAANYIIRAA